jgi:hypothetical protein
VQTPFSLNKMVVVWSLSGWRSSPTLISPTIRQEPTAKRPARSCRELVPEMGRVAVIPRKKG